MQKSVFGWFLWTIPAETDFQAIHMYYSNHLLFENTWIRKSVWFFRPIPLTAPYSCVLLHCTAFTQVLSHSLCLIIVYYSNHIAFWQFLVFIPQYSCILCCLLSPILVYYSATLQSFTMKLLILLCIIPHNMQYSCVLCYNIPL